MEPIRDTFDVVFKLWPDPNKRVGPARPASVGYIMGVRPAVEVAADFAPAHLTTSGPSLSDHLTHAYGAHEAALRIGVGVDVINELATYPEEVLDRGPARSQRPTRDRRIRTPSR